MLNSILGREWPYGTMIYTRISLTRSGAGTARIAYFTVIGYTCNKPTLNKSCLNVFDLKFIRIKSFYGRRTRVIFYGHVDSTDYMTLFAKINVANADGCNL